MVDSIIFPIVISYSPTDAAIVATIGAFLKQHRLLQNRTQYQVAVDAGATQLMLEYSIIISFLAPQCWLFPSNKH